jgi:hypothetical protein
MRRELLAALAAAGVCALIAAVAIQERAGRSPAALLAVGGKQALYGYYPYPSAYPYGGYPNGAGYAAGYYGGSYPYYGGYGGSYPYYGGYGDYGGHGAYGYPYYAYDEDNAYQQYASQEQYRQWADYAAQQQYEDSAAQANYYNWAAANSYKQPKKDVLKVASNKNTNKLVYMGDLEFGGYRHEITGGNDGGYNAPFDINGDGQEIDNWAKVTTQWKHKKGGVQLKQGGAHLKQKKLQQLHYLNTAQANAQVNNIFNSISSSDHGANNGMLQKRAQHRPKTPQFGFGNEGARAAPQDPKLTPVQGIFSSEGNGDVSIKAPRAQQLAAAAAGKARK